MRRRAALATIVLLCAPVVGCGGKGGDGGGSVTPPPPIPTFQCSGSPPAENQVVLECGVKVKPDVWQIDVIIGPSTSTDIGGFAFDVLFDPAVLAYVPGSAQSGSMLFQDGEKPLLSAQTAAGDPGRLVVGIYRTGGVGGVGVVPGTYDRIMAFSMQVMPGAQFDPDPKHLVFDKAKSQALDASDPPQSIPSITFNDQLLLSNQ